MSGKEKVYRAGIIPYIYNSYGELTFMFMRPSDPTYGGSDWQIAKGRVEDDDDNISTAIREGAEELGLKESNIDTITELGVFLGRTSVFICKVYNTTDFNPFHYETGDTEWLTLDEFEHVGRELHYPIVQTAHDHIVLMDSSDKD